MPRFLSQAALGRVLGLVLPNQRRGEGDASSRRAASRRPLCNPRRLLVLCTIVIMQLDGKSEYTSMVIVICIDVVVVASITMANEAPKVGRANKMPNYPTVLAVNART